MVLLRAGIATISILILAAGPQAQQRDSIPLPTSVQETLDHIKSFGPGLASQIAELKARNACHRPVARTSVTLTTLEGTTRRSVIRLNPMGLHQVFLGDDGQPEMDMLHVGGESFMREKRKDWVLVPKDRMGSGGLGLKLPAPEADPSIKLELLKEKRVRGIRSVGVRVGANAEVSGVTWWLDKRDCAPVAMEMFFDGPITVEYRYNEQFKLEKPAAFALQPR